MANQIIISGDESRAVIPTVETNKIVVVDNDNSNLVKVYDTATNVVRVVSYGPQGPVGPQGPSGSDANIDTGSFATTGSNTFYGNQLILGNSEAYFYSGDGRNLTNVTASYIPTNVLPSGILSGSDGTGSYSISASYAISSSYSEFSISSSYASTSSYSFDAISASYSISSSKTENSTSSSYSVTSSHAFYSISSSYSSTSSLAFSGTGSFTGSFFGDGSQLSGIVSSKWTGSNPVSRVSDVEITGSFSVSENTNLAGQLIVNSGSVIYNGLTVYGSASFMYITASQLALSSSTISVNVFEPVQRFGGLVVYDSGSSNATASLFWDSQNNHWIYQNATGSSYSGGGLMSGPRNTGSLGEEPYPTLNRVLRSQGGDHLYDSNILDNDTKIALQISAEVTGSLYVSNGITGSLLGTSSYALTASFVNSALTASLFLTGSVTSASYAATASVFITASVTSASFASTASFVNTALTASYVAASSVVGLNLSQISSGSVSASVNVGTASFSIVSGSNTFVFVSSSANVGIGTTTPLFKLDNSGSFRTFGNITTTSGSSYFVVSQSLTQPAQTGSQITSVNITPSFVYIAPLQTQTAFRIAANFSGSAAISSSQTNVIADIGATSVGSQFIINDVTSGSIYMVNDASGLPIIEANSNWDVFMYDYPKTVFKKTGSMLELGTQGDTSSFTQFRSDLIINEGLGFTYRQSQASGSTVGAVTSSLYNVTFTNVSSSVFIHAVVTGYDTASRDTISGEVKSIVRFRSGSASVVGTNFQFINSDASIVNFDVIAGSTSGSLVVYGTGSRAYQWGATVTTQII